MCVPILSGPAQLVGWVPPCPYQIQCATWIRLQLAERCLEIPPSDPLSQCLTRGSQRERLSSRGRRLSGRLEDRLATGEADSERERRWWGGADPAHGMQLAPSWPLWPSASVRDRQDRLAPVVSGIVVVSPRFWGHGRARPPCEALSLALWIRCPRGGSCLGSLRRKALTGIVGSRMPALTIGPSRSRAPVTTAEHVWWCSRCSSCGRRARVGCW